MYKNSNSNKSFVYGLVSLVLIIILVIFIQNVSTGASDYGTIIIGLFIISIGYASIIGLMHAFKSLKETNTLKKIIGFILNTSIVILIVSILIGNVLDIFRFLL